MHTDKLVDLWVGVGPFENVAANVGLATDHRTQAPGLVDCTPLTIITPLSIKSCGNI